MYKIPISLITIFHPDHFWQIDDISKLHDFPHLVKEREDQELKKIKIAEERKLKTSIENLHGGKIINFGKPQYWFRLNWIKGKHLSEILRDYSLRLIYTIETRSQAKWRVEARPNWGKEPNILPDSLSLKMMESISHSLISIRQIWINPFSLDITDDVRGPFYESGYTINIVFGPFNDECLREARIHFTKNKGLMPIREHRPFYRDSLTSEEMEILPECCFWWAEY